ncbi:MAG: hypothetical protein COB17_07920 [Sulfurimonas sp.]|nr:MAG: hypothetical protein COB17_07920 [Sulfurimonas sp.]
MKDMSIMAEYGLVTFELAKVIYQIATRDYYVSDEMVMSYYEKVLGGIYFCHNHNLYIWFKEDAEAFCEYF